MEAILKEIIVNIAELDSAEKIALDSDLADDLGLDSLMMIDLIIDIGDKCGVKINEREQAGLKTFGDVLKLVVNAPASA